MRKEERKPLEGRVGEEIVARTVGVGEEVEERSVFAVVAVPVVFLAVVSYACCQRKKNVKKKGNEMALMKKKRIIWECQERNSNKSTNSMHTFLPLVVFLFLSAALAVIAVPSPFLSPSPSPVLSPSPFAFLSLPLLVFSCLLPILSVLVLLVSPFFETTHSRRRSLPLLLHSFSSSCPLLCPVSNA